MCLDMIITMLTYVKRPYKLTKFHKRPIATVHNIFQDKVYIARLLTYMKSLKETKSNISLLYILVQNYSFSSFPETFFLH